MVRNNKKRKNGNNNLTLEQKKKKEEQRLENKKKRHGNSNKKSRKRHMKELRSRRTTTIGQNKSSSPLINTNTNWNEDSLYDMNMERSYKPVEDVRSYKVSRKYASSTQKKVSAGNRSKALQVKKYKERLNNVRIIAQIKRICTRTIK